MENIITIFWIKLQNEELHDLHNKHSQGNKIEEDVVCGAGGMYGGEKDRRVLEQKPLDRDHLEDMRRWENSKLYLKEKAWKRGGLHSSDSG